MSLQIRLAEPHEYAEVGAMTVAAYTTDDLLHEESDYVDELADAAARARGAQLWVAVDGTATDPGVLGSVTYCPPGSHYRELAHDGEGEFRMLAVSPVHRRRGTARSLVEHCLTLSRAAGDRAVVICSLREMTAAHALYQQLGFVRLPERDWRPIPEVELLAFRVVL